MPIPLRGVSRVQVDIFFALLLIARYDWMKKRNREDFLQARGQQYRQAVQFMRGVKENDIFSLLEIPTVSRGEIKQVVNALKIVNFNKEFLQELEAFAKTRE